ncbi:PREDICTED: uncharacterized protein LOC109587436 [Amphimedon queenslandica]|uniref:dCMP deaminase n=1 Tax=Amphimedon queenslandica TaxID=400682 RepID=A0AAN0JQC4_AMPQE|nr:PREDICTED: uncharacterized protein LOC109587436 [Amphimedon queenslandica]|eukprot:XP_019859235.1 PREDICTED: uncharacterized protein LOC109587436 [Amphimedon queenslandica]
MDQECKKIIAEMEKGVKAKIKEEQFKELKADLEIAKELRKDAQDKILQLRPNLQLLTQNEVFVTFVKNTKEEAKNFREKRRKKWDEYYLKIACLAALRSKDPRTPVGACIAKWPTAKSDSNSYRIAGIGYNSMPYVEGEDNDSLFPWKRHHPKATDPTPQDPTHTDHTPEGPTPESPTSKSSTPESPTSKSSTSKSSTPESPTTEGSTAEGYTTEDSTSEHFTTEGSTKTDPTLKHAYVVHAAVNAILNKTRESIKGCTIYLTHFPDNDCVHAIIEAEIREVVYLKWKSCDDDDEKDERIKELLDNNSVELREIKREEIKEEKDLKVVTELEYRIANKSDADANKAARTMAISWEQFFMGLQNYQRQDQEKKRTLKS